MCRKYFTMNIEIFLEEEVRMICPNSLTLFVKSFWGRSASTIKPKTRGTLWEWEQYTGNSSKDLNIIEKKNF